MLASCLQTHANAANVSRWIAAAISEFAKNGALAHVPLCDSLLLTLAKHAGLFISLNEPSGSSALVGSSGGATSANNPNNIGASNINYKVVPQLLSTIGELAQCHASNAQRLVKLGTSGAKSSSR